MEPAHSLNPPARASRAVLAGLLVMLAQLFIAVVLIAPEGSLSYRYNSLVQHDSYWFASIVDRGYATILPPISRKMMEVSNVAFFPAYPLAAAAVHRWTGLPTSESLLVTAQLAAWGFWSYFFLFCQRWRVSGLTQFLGAGAIAAHPTAFFLVAGYSESLFLMALLGFMYWSTAEGRTAKVLAALHGIVMSATRIVGIPCAAYPVVRRVFEGGWDGLRDVRGWWKRYAWPVALMVVSTFGAIAFFLYCLLRWGRWDLYMLTQQAGWDVLPDYLAIFKPSNYRWLVPPLNEPRKWSQLTMTLGALCLLAAGVMELIPALRRGTAWPKRIGIYFVAAVTFYIAVSGVASVQMESMLRYQFCAHALIVLALMHFLAEFRPLPVPGRALGLAVVALFIAAGLSLQGWWVWNFTRGGWVA
ncbi:MAG: hypothetical protein ABI992_07000 [Chthoniobacterales bacterium]